jgi:hypothetical protein
MKNTMILIFVLLLSSCIKDSSTLTEFKISNLTNSQIKIYVPNFETRGYIFLDTIFLIQPNSSIDHYYSDKGEDSPFLYPFGVAADTVVIFFNDTISNMYVKNDSKSRNPLDIENYSGGKRNDEYYLYEYTITENDFKLGDIAD